MGQMQLLCLARAILRKGDIIVMDEATSSIDFKTDTIIRQIMKEVFKDKTVIIIAHRLESIKECDRVF